MKPYITEREAPLLSIVIPAYNEALRIEDSIASIHQDLSDLNLSHEIIVVSDGSTDDSAAILKSITAAREEVKFVELVKNTGKGNAIRAGFAEAQGTYVLFTDADLSTPTPEIQGLLQAVYDGADVAIGSRQAPGSKIDKKQNPLRQLMGPSYRKIAQLLTGLPFQDTQCGFKLMPREIGQQLFKEVKEDRFGFDVELLCLCREKELQVVEVPVRWADSGASSVRPIRDSLLMLSSLIALGERNRFPKVFRRQLWLTALATTVALMGARLLTLGYLPLIDTTEGRYGSIALEMFLSGDWVTPRILIDGELIPFWGKPPLTFWLSSISYGLFGVSEWSTRLPSLASACGILFLLYACAKELFNQTAAALGIFIVTTSILFFGLSGTMTLDVHASFAVTGGLSMFLLGSLADPFTARRRWLGWGFFVFLGLGLLAKGPVVAVLTMGPILALTIFQRSLSSLNWLPWLRGLALTSIIAAPWYVLAEQATPGFLKYFFVNEHILRYLSSDYGDLYGKAHIWPRGTIWIFLLLAFLPWTIPALLNLRPSLRQLWSQSPPQIQKLLPLLFAWALFPAMFFTMARSILATYLLPASAGMGIFLGYQLFHAIETKHSTRNFLCILCATFILASAAALVYAFSNFPEMPSALLATTITCSALACTWLTFATRNHPTQLAAVGLSFLLVALSFTFLFKPIISDLRSSIGVVDAAKPLLSDSSRHLVVLRRWEYSMSFYTQLKVCFIRGFDDPKIDLLLSDEVPDIFIVRNKYIPTMPSGLLARLNAKSKFGRFTIFQENSSR